MSIRDAGQVRGYSTDESPLRTDIASSTPAYNQGTLVKTSLNRDGLEVLSNVYTQLVAADSVDSYAAGVITAASHSAKVGDVILFTSGVLNKIVFTIFATATNTISLAQTPVSAPSAADTFNILRFAHPIIDSSGALSANLTLVGGSAIAQGHGTAAAAVRVELPTDGNGTIASITSSVVPGTAASNLGKAEDAAHTTGDTGVMALAVANEALSNISGTDGDYTPIGVDRAGRVFVQGQIAHDGVNTGNPVVIGAEARSSNITAVANADSTKLTADLIGRLIVLPYQIPDNTIIGIAGNVTTATNTSLIAAQGSGVRIYITSLTISNLGIADVITLQDGSGGTNLWQIAMPASTSIVSVTFPTPLRTSANTALSMNTSAAGNIYISVVGYKSSN